MRWCLVILVFLEDEKLIIQARCKKINGYAGLTDHNKTIIDVRQGQDQGMIDIFNIDRWSSHFQSKIRPYFENNFLVNILADLGGDVLSQYLNLYINRSIKATRGFHVDSYKNN